jgi:hypothetical protein
MSHLSLRRFVLPQNSQYAIGSLTPMSSLVNQCQPKAQWQANRKSHQILLIIFVNVVTSGVAVPAHTRGQEQFTALLTTEDVLLDCPLTIVEALLRVNIPTRRRQHVSPMTLITEVDNQEPVLAVADFSDVAAVRTAVLTSSELRFWHLFDQA